MSDDSQRNGGIKWQGVITKHFQFLKRQKRANFRQNASLHLMVPLHTHTHTHPIACSGCFMVDSRVMFQSFSFLDFLRITQFIRSRAQHFETCQSFLKLGLGSYLLNHKDTSQRPLLRPVLSPHKSDHHLTEMLDYHQVV